MSEQNSEREIRILIGDDDPSECKRLVGFLKEKGYAAKSCQKLEQIKEWVADWRPHFLVIDLLLNEKNAATYLKQLQTNGQLGENKLKVIVLSSHNSPFNVKECLRLGASEFLAKPVKPVDILSRILLHSQEKVQLAEYSEDDRTDGNQSEYYLYLTELTLREAIKNQPKENCFFNLTKMAEMALKAVRVSVVEADQDSRAGYVRASSDDKKATGFRLNLDKYPEIDYVLNSGKVLAIDNIKRNSRMIEFAKLSRSISFNSIIVAPICKGKETWGVLSARLPENKANLNQNEVRFMQLVAHVVGLVAAKEGVVDSPADSTSSPGQRSAS